MRELPRVILMAAETLIHLPLWISKLGWFWDKLQNYAHADLQQMLCIQPSVVLLGAILLNLTPIFTFPCCTSQHHAYFFSYQFLQCVTTCNSVDILDYTINCSNWCNQHTYRKKHLWNAWLNSFWGETLKSSTISKSGALNQTQCVTALSVKLWSLRKAREKFQQSSFTHLKMVFISYYTKR